MAISQTRELESAPLREKVETQRQSESENHRTRTRTRMVRQNSPPVVPPTSKVTARTGTKVSNVLSERKQTERAFASLAADRIGGLSQALREAEQEREKREHLEEVSGISATRFLRGDRDQCRDNHCQSAQRPPAIKAWAARCRLKFALDDGQHARAIR